MTTAPDDRAYTPDHLWAVPDDGALRVGITPWWGPLAPDDVVALHLPPVGAVLRAAAPAGSIETRKAVVDLYAPCDGAVLAHNPAALADPSLCLRDPWSAWLWRMTAAPRAALWDASRYRAFVGVAR